VVVLGDGQLLAAAQLQGAAVARCHPHLLHPRAAGQGPGEGVFPAAAAHHQNAGRCGDFASGGIEGATDMNQLVLTGVKGGVGSAGREKAAGLSRLLRRPEPAGLGTVPHLLSPLRQLLPLLLLSPLALPAALAGDAAGAARDLCGDMRQRGDLIALRQQQGRLQAALAAEPSTAQALATAEALLACGAPQAALAVLARSAPAEDGAREGWLLLQWRAAHAGLHHARAVEVLALLADGDLSRLESLQLPVAEPDRAGRPPRQRLALDLLADHLVSLEAHRQAADVLLASREPGSATAARWGRGSPVGHPPAAAAARRLHRNGPWSRQLRLRPGGWWRPLLDQQLADGLSDEAARRALERRLRLSARIDDAYGEWLQRRRQDDAAQDPRLLLSGGPAAFAPSGRRSRCPPGVAISHPFPMTAYQLGPSSLRGQGQKGARHRSARRSWRWNTRMTPRPSTP
jgi:hypothetical protein